MSNEPGSLVVPVKPDVDATTFGKTLESEMEGPLGRVRGKMLEIGKLVAAGLAVGVAAVGAGIAYVGFQMDDALDNIRIKTGATGEALAGIEDSFRTVGKRVPDDLGLVSDAISLVYQRTGLTGTGLEDMTTKMLTLARLTDSDVNTVIETSSRLFGDWGLSIEQQGPALDYLFKLNQQTGVSIDSLAERMTKFGGPMRQLGFSFEETGALIAQFEQQGVNTDLVMGALRISLGKMAKAGEEPVETLSRTVQAIKDAGSAGEANALALELFGSKAGPDMAAAIREGRFEIDGLLAQIAASPETIESAAAATDGFPETFKRFRNSVILAVEPIATKLFAALDELVPKLQPVIDGIGTWLPAAFDKIASVVGPVISTVVSKLLELVPIGEKVIAFFVDLAKWIGENLDLLIDIATPLAAVVAGLYALLAASKVVAIFQAMKAAVLGLNAALLANPIVLVVAAIAALIGLLVVAYKRFEGFRNVVDSIARFFRTVFVAAFEWFTENVLPALIAQVQAMWQILKTVVGWIASTGIAVWNGLRDAIAVVIDWLSTHVGPILTELGDLFAAVFEKISWYVRVNVEIWQTIIAAALAVIRPVVGWLWDVMAPQIAAALDIISGVWSAVWRTIVSVAEVVWNTIKAQVEAGLKFIQGAIALVTGIISGDWGKAWDGIKNMAAAVWNGITSLVSGAMSVLWNVVNGGMNAVWSVISGAWNGIIEFFGGIGSSISKVTGGMWDGISGAFRAALNWVIDRWNGLEFKIPEVSFLGQTVGGFTLGVPDIPRLAMGGTAISPGLSIVGDGGNGSGAEIAALPRGASIVPLDVGAMIAGAALEAAGRDGFRDLVVVEPASTAEEIAETVDRRLAWKVSLPGVGAPA